jgi:hypothetical protein
MEWFKKKIERKNDLESLNIKEQWESQIKILTKLGILEIFPGSKELGIRGIDGKEYPVPNHQDIMARLESNKEIIGVKMEQGFMKLLLEPFALPIDTLAKKYEKAILKHFEDGKLFATKEKPTDPDVPLDLDVNQPLYKWDEYNNADGDDKLVYFPKEFSNNHQGKTKEELLSDPESGWRVWLVENMPNIPREGKGKERGKRKQLEANKTPKEYLKLLGTGEYQNESGLTPEADIMCALTHLEETNQVINDYAGLGSASYQVGAYFVASGSVPYSYWHRVARQASLDGIVASNRNSDVGCRSGVRV